MKLSKEQKSIINDISNLLIINRFPSSADELKNAFPEAFEFQYEKGKWYIDDEGDMILFNGCLDRYNNPYGCYILCGVWYDNDDTAFRLENPRLATEGEILSALSKEAEKRGFVEGARLKVFGQYIDWGNRIDNYDVNTLGWEIDDADAFSLGNKTIFVGGKWATIIEEPKEITIEEKSLEDMFNSIGDIFNEFKESIKK